MDAERYTKEVTDWAKDTWRAADEENITPFPCDALKSSMDKEFELINDQMRVEAEEFKADTKRVASILSSLKLPATLPDSAQLHAQILFKTAQVLEVLTPDRNNLMLGISDLQQELEKAEEMLEANKRRTEKYRNEFPEILKKKERWLRELSLLRSSLKSEEQELNKTQKSLFYMSKKKMQYQQEMQRYEQNLKSSGFNEFLTHEELVKLGSEVKQMEEQLVPLRLQLNSYQNLPPDLTQAQVKLEEQKLELKKLEEKVAQRLGGISIQNGNA